MINGFPGNLGDPVVSVVTAGRSPAYQLQVDPRLPCPELVGTNRGQTDGIAKRRKRSAAKRAVGSRSVS